VGLWGGQGNASSNASFSLDISYKDDVTVILLHGVSFIL
jgi:hypothetical protein